MNTAVDNKPAVSAWAPFAIGPFALLWSATLVSNIGTWMHDVGAGWLMTTLDPTPSVVTLVQAATTLPVFLFALFAGTLADRIDKRRLLIAVNLAMVVVVGLLAALVALERVTPTLLVAFTFLIGTGAAFMGPAWQSVVPELVPRSHLAPAIALNSMGINISRAIGPALAGVLITAVGLTAPFVLNAVSHIVIIAALLLWRRAPLPAPALPPEPIGAAMLTGIRHAAHNAPFKATLLRAASYFLFASAYWALLPLVARNAPGGGAALYGYLLASVGAGAVGGALLLPRLKRLADTDRLAMLGVVVTAFAMLLLALAPAAWASPVAAFTSGIGWIVVLTSLNISAQTALPNWIRARGLAIFLMTFFGAMAVGSTLWGQVATGLSVPTALIIAAAGAVLALPFVHQARLGQGEALDLSASAFWPAPAVDQRIDDADARGPAMVTVEYRIDPADEAVFLAAVHELAQERYRNGAYQWNVFQCIGEPERWIESFLISSWTEHLRQHERTTGHDRDLRDAVRRYHRDDTKPAVVHWLAPATSSNPED